MGGKSSARGSLALAILATIVFGLASSMSAARGATNEQVQRGRELFERIWDTEDNGSPGDGLGPMYNARSCVACHFAGGTGGAGDNEHNVELLTPKVPVDKDRMDAILQRVRLLHPAFTSGVTAILHRYSTDDHYLRFRQTILGLTPPLDKVVNEEIFLREVRARQGTGPIKTITTRDHDQLLLSERSTPAVFGAGLIDSIPTRELQRIAAEQSEENPDVTGRLVGRFGWRGQIGTLKDFVMGACAVELGLEVPGHSQSQNPIDGGRGPVQRPLDLTQQECDDLIAFVASLSPPRRIGPSNPQEAVIVKNGEAMFDTIGCALCHPAKVGRVDGIYSDLLLHDMGPKLEDPSPALASLPTSSTPQYYSSIDTQSLLVIERRREWRTPPLWGLRDSGPYLHDGRAKSVEEAILAHGGEASSAVDRYRFLPEPERQRVLRFLSKLAAPARAPTRKSAVAANAQRSPSNGMAGGSTGLPASFAAE